MKSSRIICCCRATLQGLLTGDSSVWRKGTSGHACAAVHDTSFPRGLVHNESDSNDDVIKTGPGMLCQLVLENGAWLWGNCWFSRQWSMATPLQAVHNSQQHGERTSLEKVYGFTINNETQMTFFTFWLAMQGFFSFFFFLSSLHGGVGGSSLNFNLGEIKTTLQKQVNRK